MFLYKKKSREGVSPVPREGGGGGEGGEGGEGEVGGEGA